MERIDEAVRMAAALAEPPESNFVRRNVYKDLEEYRRQGMGEETAYREATFRVFGCPPGTCSFSLVLSRLTVGPRTKKNPGPIEIDPGCPFFIRR